MKSGTGNLYSSDKVRNKESVMRLINYCNCAILSSQLATDVQMAYTVVNLHIMTSTSHSNIKLADCINIHSLVHCLAVCSAGPVLNARSCL